MNCDKKSNRILKEGCDFSNDEFSFVKCIKLRVPSASLVHANRFLYSPKDPG